MAGVTKQEVKKIAITAPLTGYVKSSGTIISTDTILQAFQKIDGNMDNLYTIIGTVQAGNNLFLYYNFR